jgi:hypothetical protein
MADSKIEEIFNAAVPLDPTDRLRLIARLWASLPQDSIAAPTWQNRNSVQRCLNGADSDGLSGVPWKILERAADRQAQETYWKPYSAPRRFDLATIFVVTTAYCLFFAAMSAMPLPGVASLIAAGFVTMVGLGQAFLYGGVKPRRASIMVGMVLCWISSAIPFIFIQPRAISIYGQNFLLGVFLYIFAVGSISGAILGYLSGTVVGGVFLISDRVRGRFWPTRNNPVELRPSATTEPSSSPDAS